MFINFFDSVTLKVPDVKFIRSLLARYLIKTPSDPRLFPRCHNYHQLNYYLGDGMREILWHFEFATIFDCLLLSSKTTLRCLL